MALFKSIVLAQTRFHRANETASRVSYETTRAMPCAMLCGTPRPSPRARLSEVYMWSADRASRMSCVKLYLWSRATPDKQRHVTCSQYDSPSRQSPRFTTHDHTDNERCQVLFVTAVTSNGIPKLPVYATKLRQLPHFMPSALRQLPSFMPHPLRHLPDFTLHALRQLPRFLPSALHKSPRFMPLALRKLPHFTQLALSQLPRFLPSALR